MTYRRHLITHIIMNNAYSRENTRLDSACHHLSCFTGDRYYFRLTTGTIQQQSKSLFMLYVDQFRDNPLHHTLNTYPKHITSKHITSKHRHIASCFTNIPPALITQISGEKLIHFYQNAAINARALLLFPALTDLGCVLYL